MCLPETHTIQIQHEYNTNTIQIHVIPHKDNTNTIQKQHTYNTRTIQTQHKYNTHTIQIRHTYNTNTTHMQLIQHKDNTNTIQLKHKYNTNTICNFFNLQCDDSSATYCGLGQCPGRILRQTKIKYKGRWLSHLALCSSKGTPWHPNCSTRCPKGTH